MLSYSQLYNTCEYICWVNKQYLLTAAVQITPYISKVFSSTELYVVADCRDQNKLYKDLCVTSTEHEPTVLCNISVHRSKYCLEISIASR